MKYAKQLIIASLITACWNVQIKLKVKIWSCLTSTKKHDQILKRHRLQCQNRAAYVPWVSVKKLFRQNVNIRGSRSGIIDRLLRNRIHYSRHWGIRCSIHVMQSHQWNRMAHNWKYTYQNKQQQQQSFYGPTSIFISILCHSVWLFHRQSCPRPDDADPGSMDCLSWIRCTAPSMQHPPLRAEVHVSIASHCSCSESAGLL